MNSLEIICLVACSVVLLAAVDASPVVSVQRSEEPQPMRSDVYPGDEEAERELLDQFQHTVEEDQAPMIKRAQTFVRFGKRAQTFVRFGKRAQTFVRFG